MTHFEYFDEPDICDFVVHYKRGEENYVCFGASYGEILELAKIRACERFEEKFEANDALLEQVEWFHCRVFSQRSVDRKEVSKTGVWLDPQVGTKPKDKIRVLAQLLAGQYQVVSTAFLQGNFYNEVGKWS